VSETEEAPVLYRFMGAYGQIRVRNTHPTFQMRSPWVARGVKQFAVLSSADCHPADIAHMLQATITVRETRNREVVTEQRPMPVEIPEAGKEESR